MNLLNPRSLFGSAAVFNWLAGLPILLAGGLVSTLFGLPPPSNLLFSQIAGMAVLLFGYGYWCESREPGKHRAAITLGMIGKVCIFLLAIGHLLAGDVNWVFPALASVDMTYAVLFWLYLGRTRTA